MKPALTRLVKILLGTILIVSPFFFVSPLLKSLSLVSVHIRESHGFFRQPADPACHSRSVSRLFFKYSQCQIPSPSSSATSSFLSPVPLESHPLSYLKSPSSRTFRSQLASLLKKVPLPVIVAQTSQDDSPTLSISSQINPPLTGKTGSYTIAVLGDSMIDVMQPELPQIKQALKKYYPNAQFRLLNYGVGASNIEAGAERLTSGYQYQGREFVPLLSQNPDIIVIESFAYNHWDNDQTGLDRQWLALGKIVSTISSQSRAKIILAAAIGPDQNTLCDGVVGWQLLPEKKQEKAQTIRAYLQNLVNFASSQGYPLADAYHASLDTSGNGKAIYINAGDHLHPSGPGGELLAQKIVEAIYQHNLL